MEVFKDNSIGDLELATIVENINSLKKEFENFAPLQGEQEPEKYESERKYLDGLLGRLKTFFEGQYKTLKENQPEAYCTLRSLECCIWIAKYNSIVNSRGREQELEKEEIRNKLNTWFIKTVGRYCANEKLVLDLSGVDLRGFPLSGVNFGRANLARANLQGADLSSIKLDEADLSEVSLDGAILDRADIYETNFEGAKMINCSLRNAEIMKSNLTRVDLTGATLQETNFFRSNFSGADLSGIKALPADETPIEEPKANQPSSSLDNIRQTARKLALFSAGIEIQPVGVYEDYFVGLTRFLHVNLTGAIQSGNPVTKEWLESLGNLTCFEATFTD